MYYIASAQKRNEKDLYLICIRKMAFSETVVHIQLIYSNVFTQNSGRTFLTGY